MPRTRMLGVLLALLVFAGAAQARNPQIAGLQVALKTRGFYKARIDAIAGPATAEALRRFQRRAGLKVDGLAGSRTRAALGRLGRPLYGARVLQRGNVGWDVSVLQFLLAWRGYRPGKIDGHFGHRTAVVLRRFQRRSGLKPDAIAGRLTLSRLCAWSSCMPSRVSPRPAYRRYVVRWGDSLTAISRRSGLSVAAIARANHLDPHKVLRAGAILRLPAYASSRVPGATSARASSVRTAIAYWSRHYGVNPHLARAVAWMESGYQNHVRSRRGAWGVMQVTRGTWAFVEAVLIGRPIPRTTEGNVRVGIAYLRHLLRQFRGSERLAVAAYYQGARSVRRRGILGETSTYVNNVLALKQRL